MWPGIGQRSALGDHDKLNAIHWCSSKLGFSSLSHTAFYAAVFAYFSLYFLVAQRVKRLSAMQEIWVRSLGQADPLQKEMATHSSILTWEIPWTEDLVGYSPWDHKESDKTEHARKSDP